ncbi:ArgE/DapE family deacylase [Levilactobacillus acidifarinae]|uniref:Probable succinyl-diaminopimelate desuccinylase n=1 Tax=Levilactobacillus acidifarinae DSM 19394 = JCM 15949 TaxID=1423715 RepID=A0A0R1LU52_9LACO|nr:ArgE/DapE family deacylase [Levilactobacillus acidifarinae]KRK96708.1 succinyl-diaminopimelate desuccinylase [Levilactobacillus acidifarinae DSM 19394]GEO70405.1 succinyl-diaminopimelate desuccinylase [Levilactobacillus acidifarinae]
METTAKLQLLADLIKIRSVNDHELQVAKYLKGVFDRVGIDSQIIPLTGDRANLVATLGHGQPVLAVSGHMDVVDVDEAHWDTDPFEMVTKGDRLYGRGVTDMKDGLAALVIAMIELKEQAVPLNGTIRLLATVGEEVGELGAKALTAAGYMQDVTGLLVGEPTGYRLMYANKGTMNLTVTSTGRAAHSSMPQLGNNAIFHLINALQLMQTEFEKMTDGVRNDTLGQTVYNVDVINGGNQVNAIPGSATAQINLRTIPELSNHAIVRNFERVLDQYNQTTNGHVTLEMATDIGPLVGATNGKLTRLIQKIGNPYAAKQTITAEEREYEAKILKLLKLPYSPTEILAMSSPGGTDGAQFLKDHPVGFDYVVFGPGNDSQHQDNEWTSKSQYLDFIEIYKQVLTQYFN